MQRETKIALITGSSRGIGRVAAMKLAEAGIFVYMNYRVISVVVETGNAGQVAYAAGNTYQGRALYVMPARNYC